VNVAVGTDGGVVAVKTVCNTQPSILVSVRMRTQGTVPTFTISGRTWTTIPLLRVVITDPEPGSVRKVAPPPEGEVMTA
jgi:hypothetical protein